MKIQNIFNRRKCEKNDCTKELHDTYLKLDENLETINDRLFVELMKRMVGEQNKKVCDIAEGFVLSKNETIKYWKRRYEDERKKNEERFFK